MPRRALGRAADSPPTFTRTNVDTGITGASFTSVGEVFAGEQDIVTSGYGTLDVSGRPIGPGTLQLYRPGANLADWTKVTVFGTDADIIFPNAPTIGDVDGDGTTTSSSRPATSSGPTPRRRVRPAAASPGGEHRERRRRPLCPPRHHHRPALAYHGVQLVDLDGDDIRDLVTVGEQAVTAGNLEDDIVQTQFLKGNADHTFEAPVPLSTNLGGSQPVVHDVDGDTDLDIITVAVLPHLQRPQRGGADVLWFEHGDSDGDLVAADFTPHKIATLKDTPAGRGAGMGFQILPVLGFREPGTVSWIGTNHVNRCTTPILPIREQVMEFVPPDLRAQWRADHAVRPGHPRAGLPVRTTPPADLQRRDHLARQLRPGRSRRLRARRPRRRRRHRPRGLR